MGQDESVLVLPRITCEWQGIGAYITLRSAAGRVQIPPALLNVTWPSE